MQLVMTTKEIIAMATKKDGNRGKNKKTRKRKAMKAKANGQGIVKEAKPPTATASNQDGTNNVNVTANVTAYNERPVATEAGRDRGTVTVQAALIAGVVAIIVALIQFALPSRMPLPPPNGHVIEDPLTPHDASHDARVPIPRHGKKKQEHKYNQCKDAKPKVSCDERAGTPNPLEPMSVPTTDDYEVASDVVTDGEEHTQVIAATMRQGPPSVEP
jgi:hypothetical protein